MSASAIYVGRVSHRRIEPRRHSLSYPVWMLLLDLDEAELLERHPLWSARRPAPVRFRPSDFLDAGERPLGDVARELAAERLGSAPAGAVRVLAMPRAAGVGFNPVSFTYLHGLDGGLEALVAEVTNTPWGERHHYVVAAEGGSVRARLGKRLHVSPFMPMEQTYDFEASDPGDSLRVRIASEQGGRLVFEASMALRRRELSRREMTRVLLRHPTPPLTTLARIYAHAVRLRLKSVPIHPRPTTVP